MRRNPEIRRDNLLEMLQTAKLHRVDEVVKRVDVSKPTLYRDIDILTKRGFIRKSYGCIEVLGGKQVDIQYEKRLKKNGPLKKEIAAAAHKLVIPGDTVFLDSSSTCYYLAEMLFSKPVRELTVISNSVHMLSLGKRAGSEVKFISTGGRLDYTMNAFLGDLVKQFLDQVVFGKIFVSGAGFSLERGLTTTNDYILGIIKSAVKNGMKKFCLVDSSKYQRDCPFRVAGLDAFDAVISDNRLDPYEVSRFKEAGINLFLS